jgi:hypothetical protein
MHACTLPPSPCREWSLQATRHSDRASTTHASPVYLPPSPQAHARLAVASAEGKGSPGSPRPQDAEGYYAGLLTRKLNESNGASSADMLKRNLSLAGGVSGLLALLVLGFLASNGLLNL